jgi:thiosulfate/3-mercaptopyruvate sulfurtransferase
VKALPGARPLISVPELAGLLNSERPPALLDVRWRLGGPAGIEFYQAAHLPGAVFIDLDSALAGPPGSRAGGRHPLPERGVFEAAMRAAGLNDGQLAVAYDDAGATIAARLWWLLRYFGHDRVAVLDGGLGAWTAAGQPVTTDAPRPERGSFTAGPGGGMPVLDEAGAARLGRAGRLLDARAAERYSGEVEPVDPAAGHIPGARSAPATGNVSADSTFLPPAELRARFAGLGLPITGAGNRAADPGVTAGPGPEPLVGAYCGSGVTAAQEVLALELAGLQAALYVGSWSAWSADQKRPVATGSDPG